MTKSDIGGTPGMKISAIGIPWYEEADYPAILGLMMDAHVLPATYSVWLQRAEQLERNLAGQGQVTVRAVIKPQTFAGWCIVRNHTQIDPKARMAFANEEAARQIGL